MPLSHNAFRRLSARFWLFPLLAVGVFAGSRGLPAAEPSPARPNILFILTDDQAPTALGAAGNTEIHTPHLDRLFRQGVRLTNAFVATPVCSPSRAELMTSRFSSELGIHDWINNRAEPMLGLRQEFTTWPSLLQQAGYTTGLVGKWHLGDLDEFHPTKRGYSYFAGFRSGGTVVVNPTLEVDGEKKKHQGLTTDVLTDYALQFLEDHAAGPFALSVHYRAPHAPWLPVAPEDSAPYADLDPTLPEPDFPLLDTPRLKKMTREYYGSMSGVDRNVGRLLAKLDEQKLTQNTVVIYTSDHGYHTGHHGLWYKGNAHWMLTELPPQRWPQIDRVRRPNLFDQALRVPTVVRFPGAQPGELSQTISNIDWMPTLLAIAGVKPSATLQLRGHDFSPLLRGEQIADWSNTLYAEYDMRHGAKTQMRAIRTPQWKLMIDFLNEGRDELYDLKNDPREHTNLADSTRPEIVAKKAELKRLLQQQMESIQ
ncbi:sulfatase family protein [Lignipirellula cremea]|uniref:Choline-sulfatase n=1 Tax=Lignipirellula cremea TaxID=2528010 RepID=A0A518DRU6_9BACT|nr:sulfatase-like hydrolase/transferase [Lignipirellula cremea]QDU94565.1 Choline-sulfatase [Lignipirellula cremea]